MQEKYGTDLRVVGVNAWDEPREDLQAFVDDLKLPYTVLLNGHEPFKTSYRGKWVPHSYLIDPEGVIRYTHEGWEDGDQQKLEKRIDKLLAKKT